MDIYIISTHTTHAQTLGEMETLSGLLAHTPKPYVQYVLVLVRTNLSAVCKENHIGFIKRLADRPHDDSCGGLARVFPTLTFSISVTVGGPGRMIDKMKTLPSFVHNTAVLNLVAQDNASVAVELLQ